MFWGLNSYVFKKNFPFWGIENHATDCYIAHGFVDMTVHGVFFIPQPDIFIMGLLDNYTGIGMSPRPRWQHQIAMSNFHKNILVKLI